MKHTIFKRALLIMSLMAVLGILVYEARTIYHTPVAKGTHRTRTANADRLVRHLFSLTPTPDRVYYQNKVIVLMYHEVTKAPPDPGALRLTNFTKQLDEMKANGFRWITMKEYTDFILHKAKVPDNALLMTFDDGYESFYTDTFPVLKAYRVPATNFLITSTISNPKHIGIRKLTWDQIQQMHAEGIDFYNHTNDQHAYGYSNAARTKQKPLLMGPVYSKKLGRMETEDEFKQRVYTDLGTADKKLFKHLHNDRNVLAFPYGGYTKETLEICRSLGIDVTFTVKRGINSPGQTNGYRVNAGGIHNIPEVLVQYMKEGAPLRPLPFAQGPNQAS
ncbi:polysaccharide deacetylase family protein [Paenibacillus peoriae]|uniref:polysaccharide deacetylase family protein n=1 Tax=Paenibacillus peoriae TaxID=59893 RepID=UPI00030DF069|nr:polysaccharide deacetylase family protein [Paenibacillus peoriae]MEC0182263.1 polysaccharide deacetylase family protein [Paenibacillus peoriae]